MPLGEKHVNLVSGVPAPVGPVKAVPLAEASEISLLTDDHDDTDILIVTDNVLSSADVEPSSDSMSPMPAQPSLPASDTAQQGHPTSAETQEKRATAAVTREDGVNHENELDTLHNQSPDDANAEAVKDADTGVRVQTNGAPDALDTPLTTQISLQLQPPPPLTAPHSRTVTPSQGGQSPVAESEVTHEQVRARSTDSTQTEEITEDGTAKQTDRDEPAAAESPSSSPKAFLLPVVALGSRYDIPVTADTPIFAVIREVAEMAVPPERADALGEVEAIMYHDNEPLNPDSTVGALPEGSVLHFHLSASATAKMSPSLSFFPSQLRSSRRLPSQTETSHLLPTFHPSFASFSQYQSGQGPVLVPAHRQPILGATGPNASLSHRHRGSSASSAPFYIGGNVSVAPSAAARKRPSVSASALSPYAASAGPSRASRPVDDTPGTVCWEDGDGSPCYTSIQVEPQRVPICDTRDCPPPANPDRHLSHAASTTRVRSMLALNGNGVLASSPYPAGSMFVAPPFGGGGRAPVAYSVLSPTALEGPLPQLHSTASTASVLGTCDAAPARATHTAGTSAHRRQVAPLPQHAAASSEDRGGGAPSMASKASLSGASISEEMQSRADRLAESTMHDDQYSIVYVHLPASEPTNALGEIIDTLGDAQAEKNGRAGRGKRAGRLGELAALAEQTSHTTSASSPQRSDMRRLRFDRRFPVGALREMFSVPLQLPLYAGSDPVEDERKSMNDLHLEGYTVFSFANKRPSSALIAAPYLNSPVASPPPPAALERDTPRTANTKVLSLSDLSRPALGHTNSTAPSSASLAHPAGVYAVMPSAGAFWSAAPAIQPVLVAGSDGRLVSMAPLRLEQARPSLILSPIGRASVSGSALDDELYSIRELATHNSLAPATQPQQIYPARRSSGHSPDGALWASTTLSSHHRSSANLLPQNTTQPFMADSGASAPGTASGVSGERDTSALSRPSTISAVLEDVDGSPRSGVQRDFVFPPASSPAAPTAHTRGHCHHLVPLEATDATAASAPAAAHLDGPKGRKRTKSDARRASVGEATASDSAKRSASFSRLASDSWKRVKGSLKKLKSRTQRSPPTAETCDAAAMASPTPLHQIQSGTGTRTGKRPCSDQDTKRATGGEAHSPATAVAADPKHEVQPAAVPVHEGMPTVAENTTVQAAVPAEAETHNDQEVSIPPMGRDTRVSFREHSEHARSLSIATSSDGENAVIDINNLSSASADVPSHPQSDHDLDDSTRPAPARVMSASEASTPHSPSFRSPSTPSRRPSPLDPQCLIPRSDAPLPTDGDHQHRRHTPAHQPSQSQPSPLPRTTPNSTAGHTPPRKRSGTLAPDQVLPMRSIEVGYGSPHTRAHPDGHKETSTKSTKSTKSKKSKKAKDKEKKNRKSLMREETLTQGTVSRPLLAKRKKDRSPSADEIHAEEEEPESTESSARRALADEGAADVDTGCGRHPRVKRRVPSITAKEVGQPVKNEASAVSAPHRESCTSAGITSFDETVPRLSPEELALVVGSTPSASALTVRGNDVRLVRKGSDQREETAAKRHANSADTPGATPPPNLISAPPDTSVSMGPVSLSTTKQPDTLSTACNLTSPPREPKIDALPVPVPVGKRNSDNSTLSGSSQSPKKSAGAALTSRWDTTPSPTSILVPTRQHTAGSPSSGAAPAKYMTRSNSFRRNSQGAARHLQQPPTPAAGSPHVLSRGSPVHQDRRGSSSTNSGSLTSPDRALPSEATSPSSSTQRYSVDSTSHQGRIRISVCDPLDSSKINFNVPVFADCPVGMLRQWLHEEVSLRLEGKDKPVPRFHNRLEYGVFCGDARVIDDAVLTFAKATGGKNDCVFSLRKLVDDRTMGIAEYGSSNGVAQRASDSST